MEEQTNDGATGLTDEATDHLGDDKKLKKRRKTDRRRKAWITVGDKVYLYIERFKLQWKQDGKKEGFFMFTGKNQLKTKAGFSSDLLTFIKASNIKQQ